jgi:hypothetical protein
VLVQYRRDRVKRRLRFWCKRRRRVKCRAGLRWRLLLLHLFNSAKTAYAHNSRGHRYLETRSRICQFHRLPSPSPPSLFERAVQHQSRMRNCCLASREVRLGAEYLPSRRARYQGRRRRRGLGRCRLCNSNRGNVQCRSTSWVPGLLAPFQVLVRPRLVIPSLAVKVRSRLCYSMRVLMSQTEIRQIDFAALHREGYRAIVFDKDNCLVGTPHLAFYCPC